MVQQLLFFSAGKDEWNPLAAIESFPYAIGRVKTCRG
jgi:hypothetical protein